ncbi:MAG: hypothetical protein IKY98_05670 [Alphaproteobacteria bacterium]|nr:hypothetical protein [Alphaproteobacteria bacterium]
MNKMQKIKQMLYMLIFIGIIYCLPIERFVPYLLPLSFVVCAIVFAYGLWHAKKRGLFVVLLSGLLVFGLSGQSYAYDIVNCGSERGQEAQTDCIRRNIIGLRGDLCGAEMNGRTVDNKLKNKAYYVQARISELRAAGVNIDSDMSSTAECATEYAEYAADTQRRFEDDCKKVIETFEEGMKDCWACDMVEIMLLAIQRVAAEAYHVLRNFSYGLLAVMFLFWIAFKVMYMVSGLSDYEAFFTELLFRSVAVLISVALLQAPVVDFFRIAVSPFVSMSAGLAGELTKASLTDGQTTFYDAVVSGSGLSLNQEDPKENCMLYCDYLAEADESQLKYTRQQLVSMGLTDSGGGLTPTGQFMMQQMNGTGYSSSQSDQMGYLAFLDYRSFSGMMCLTCQTYNQSLPYVAIGERLACYGIHHGIDKADIAGVFEIDFKEWGIYLPNIPYIIVGYALVIAFSIISLIVGFYIMDIVLRMGYVIALLPLLIAAWAFPISREYTKKGWDLLIFGLLEFIGVALMMALFMNVFLCLMPGGNGSGASQITTNVINYMKENNQDDVESLFVIFAFMPSDAATVATMVAALASPFAVGFTFLIMILIVVFIGYKMLSSVKGVVSNLSGISPGIPNVTLGAVAGMVQAGVAAAGLAATGVQVMGSKLSKKAGSSISKKASSSRFSDVDPTSSGAEGKNIADEVNKPKKQTGQKAGQAIEKGTDSTAKAMDETGKGIGKGGRSAGKGLMNSGKAACSSGYGAIVGVPMMIAGAAIAAVSTVAEAGVRTGAAAVKYGGKAAGKAVQKGGAAYDKMRASMKKRGEALKGGDNRMRNRGWDKIESGAKLMQNGTLTGGLSGLKTVIAGVILLQMGKVIPSAGKMWTAITGRVKNRTIQSPPK